MPSPPYPIFLNLENRNVLIVGGGAVGLRKARGLLQSGAAVTAVSPRFSAEWPALEGVEKVSAPYQASHMQHSPPFKLVFAATNVAEVNAAVEQDARGLNILCCRCDDTEAGDFTGGATYHHGGESVGGGGAGVTLAVSTRRSSPALAAALRDHLAQQIDDSWQVWAGLLERFRPVIKDRVADPAIRRALLQRLASPETRGLIQARGPQRAADEIQHWVAAAGGSDVR